MNKDTFSALRIVDANQNRAREAFRVVEDFCRFALNHPELSEECKTIRHLLGQLVRQLDSDELLQARDTPNDVGTEISLPSENRRSDAQDVVEANLKRATEALRSLEEFVKILEPKVAGQLEQLRYRTYTLEQGVTLLLHSQLALGSRRLMLLTDDRWDAAERDQVLPALLDAGVDILQVRIKSGDDRTKLESVRHFVRLVQRWNSQNSDRQRVLTIVNDRPDLAVLAGADGVHLGQEDLDFRDARQVFPRGLIGISTHDIAQVREAASLGASYIGCGPTFPSQTKSFEAFPGLPFLEQVLENSTPPAYAIGGISQSNLSQVLSTGIQHVAISSAILDATNPIAATTELAQLLRNNSHPSPPQEIK